MFVMKDGNWDIEKLVEFYIQACIDEWNRRNADVVKDLGPLVYEDCLHDPEDQACEYVSMQHLINRIVDEVISELKTAHIPLRKTLIGFGYKSGMNDAIELINDMKISVIVEVKSE